jgi:hypothetical protein
VQGDGELTQALGAGEQAEGYASLRITNRQGVVNAVGEAITVHAGEHYVLSAAVRGSGHSVFHGLQLQGQSWVTAGAAHCATSDSWKRCGSLITVKPEWDGQSFRPMFSISAAGGSVLIDAVQLRKVDGSWPGRDEPALR